MNKFYLTLTSIFFTGFIFLGIGSKAQSDFTVSAIVKPVNCYGTATGAITLTVTGGSGNFTFYWMTGQRTKDLTNLTPGAYIVWVTDAVNNLTKDLSYIITQPEQPLELLSLQKAANYNGLDMSCAGTNDAALSISVQGGTAPYVYSIDRTNFKTGNIFTNLVAGTYYATIKDARGCMASNDPNGTVPLSEMGWVAPVVIESPAPIVTEPIIVNPVSVLPVGVNSYTIYLGYSLQTILLYSGNVTGGTGYYTYNWTPTTSVSNPTSPSTMVTPRDTTIYNLTITDQNNCSTSTSVTINVVNLSSSSSTAGTTSTNGSVFLCHNGITIRVAKSAIQPHINHGDRLGACSGNATNRTIQSMDAVALESLDTFRFGVSPNPSNGNFTVTLPENALRIQIVNTTGQVIEQRENIMHLSKMAIDFSGRAPGVYFVKLLLEDGSIQTSKLILK